MISHEFILASKTIVAGNGIRSGGVHIRNGIIVQILNEDQFPAGIPVEDSGNLAVMPGIVDTHVHINEPGRTEWEGFETATRAAAAGGITTLVDMPLNSSPVTTTLTALGAKLSAAQGELRVDCGFYAGLIPGNANSIEPLLDAGVLGVKAFLIHSGIDEFPNATEHDLRSAMPIIAKHGLPLLVHCELTKSFPQSAIGNPQSYRDYLASRPRTWEHDAIRLMIDLCGEYNCRTHIVHLSSADEVPMLQNARESGLPLTVETCPHYLYFTAEEIADGDTRFKCAPPIRERENRERLWNALRDGIIDCIVSDHSPSVPSMKCLESGDFQKAWGGIASLQFGLSIIWSEARTRKFSLNDIARWMCEQPARLVGLTNRKGMIAAGYDADIVVWDPHEEFTVEPSMIQHRHKVTPYEGKKLTGKIHATYLRGKKIFHHGIVNDVPTGNIFLNGEMNAHHN